VIETDYELQVGDRVRTARTRKFGVYEGVIDSDEHVVRLDAGGHSYCGVPPTVVTEREVTVYPYVMDDSSDEPPTPAFDGPIERAGKALLGAAQASGYLPFIGVSIDPHGFTHEGVLHVAPDGHKPQVAWICDRTCPCQPQHRDEA
jgi:hypothetical protein